GIPKGDKLELIIQKAVELGAFGIIPVEMSRSVVKIEEMKRKSKQERWQAIAESAAKQSKRNVIPEVSEAVSYRRAMEMAAKMDVFLVPYENEEGMKATAEALGRIRRGCSVGILIGPEGGFEEKEVEAACGVGGIAVSLGKRILRAETAAIASVAMCMLYVETKMESDTE
ncbi:MAG: RNA methyltransferase, partial [Clostridia bacterium]|nr:RNA methyltransferase [Clostridia bacterium]